MSGSATESIPEHSMKKQDALFSGMLMLTDLFSAKILVGEMLLNLYKPHDFYASVENNFCFLLLSNLSLVHLLHQA